MYDLLPMQFKPEHAMHAILSYSSQFPAASSPGHYRFFIWRLAARFQKRLDLASMHVFNGYRLPSGHAPSWYTCLAS